MLSGHRYRTRRVVKSVFEGPVDNTNVVSNGVAGAYGVSETPFNCLKSGVRCMGDKDCMARWVVLLRKPRDREPQRHLHLAIACLVIAFQTKDAFIAERHELNGVTFTAAIHEKKRGHPGSFVVVVEGGVKDDFGWDDRVGGCDHAIKAGIETEDVQRSHGRSKVRWLW